MKLTPIITAAALALASSSALAADYTLTLGAKPGSDISPEMYGIFFEDINYGADGGLYAEMIKNRSFEFPQSLMGWRAFGKFEVREGDGPFDRNPHYVRLNPAGHRVKFSGIENEGFFGVAFKKGETYDFSMYARVPDGGKAKVRVELFDPSADGESQVAASHSFEITSKEWTKLTCTLTPDATVREGRFRIFLKKPDDNAVDLEHVSLFPHNTWKNRPNGLRADLAQALYDLNPGVFRFPGGCIVEGTDLPDRYQWKNTVGPVENRPLNLNRWQFEFLHRFASDYYQSYGLGFYEYFQLAEDLGAAPLPVLNVGMVCQYENPDPSAHQHVDNLGEYIQDAIDLVEFANGDTTTTWGALRAQMGHPAPFGLKYIAIGNEQWGPEYVERLEPFVKAMRKACPEIKIIGSSGPYSDGEFFDHLWPEMRRLNVDLVDEHYYKPDDWYRDNAARYDAYPRKGPKVFAGEYACHTPGRKYNNYGASLLEAAFMTGLERNADVVRMATYAPLFAHEKGWQWRPDMIWYDNDTRHLTSSYFVQQLYGTRGGDHVLPLTLDGKPLTGQDGIYASASCSKKEGKIYVKIVNTNDTPRTFSLSGKGAKKLGEGDVVTLLPPPEGDPRYYLPEWLSTADVNPAQELTVPARSAAFYVFNTK